MIKKYIFAFLTIMSIFTISGCGDSEKNLGITTDEFILTYNNELEKLGSQSKKQLNELKIVSADESNGQFNLENIPTNRIALKFNIDENSSEKYIKLVTFEIFEESYYGKDAKENIENAELAKKAFASAATQKRSNSKKIDEVVNSSRGEQEGNILKDDGIVFAWLDYSPGGKYLIAAENYAEQNQEIIMAEKNKELTKEVAEKNEQLKIKEEQERKAKAEQENQNKEFINADEFSHPTDPILVKASFVPSNSEVKNHKQAILAEYKCAWCNKTMTLFAYDTYPLPPLDMKCPKNPNDKPYHAFETVYDKHWYSIDGEWR